ncbi:MAG: tRNA (adenosine(37)-N6)-dimethylallyltransferase MiaA, partial [Deltaproteobacteria bacterium]|nr:tRNA (adenosine(37)-N6)-dimethylallyltransferase MiaA [Deltaproteobacteria bacterium]
MERAPKPRIIVITGPTASGKTALALEAAERLGAEIISADSMQVYRRLDIGTAKPTPAERRRIPHHLIDVADPDEHYHAGRFREEAGRSIDDVLGRGKVALVVGGTALYLKALLHGLAACPGRDPEVRAEIEGRWDAGEAALLLDELRAADPLAARRLHPNDRTRIVRALEVWRSTGRPLSSFHDEHGFAESPYEVLLLGVWLERAELYRRVDRRVEAMLAAGWIDEVRSLLREGLSPDLPALQGILYLRGALAAPAARGHAVARLVVLLRALGARGDA